MHKKYRRAIQLVIFAGMFIVPVLNLLELYFIRGTFISMDIGSAAIADPVMISQTIFANRTLSFAMLASAVIPILLVLILGRVWCSWGCPYTTLMEWLEKIPFVRGKAKINQAKVAGGVDRKRTTIVRYIIFIALLTLVGVFGVPVLHMISPPAVMSTEALILVKGFAVTVGVFYILLIVAVDIFFSRRFVCRYFCPTGTCLSLMTPKKSLHVAYSGTCVNCKKCVRVCPMGLNPMTQAQDRLCHNCGECIAVCPDKTEPLKWEI